MGEFRSLTAYVDDPTVVLTICALITLGGLGFIVLNELYEYREYPSFICAFKDRIDNDRHSNSRWQPF